MKSATVFVSACLLAAVSYTHLDVYKRQVEQYLTIKRSGLL